MGDQLGLLDAEFFDFETPQVALHIGGIWVFDGPPPAQHRIEERYRSHLVAQPRLRQRLRTHRVERPEWVDDRHFELAYHLRRVRLPRPGTHEQLQTLIGRIMSYPLDDTRPLWETWVIEGLAGDQWAVLSKLHHSLVDGKAAMSMLGSLLDPPAGTAQAVTTTQSTKTTQPARTADTAHRAAAGVGAVARVVLDTARHPRASAARVIGTVSGTARLVAAARPATRTSLAGPLGAARRYRTATIALADVDHVRHEWGGTRNDVVLALVTRAFRELLIGRGEVPDAHALRALVPVGLPATASAGNHVSALLIELPVHLPDPIEAYAEVGERTRRAKATQESAAADTLVSLAGHLPSVLVSAGVRAALKVPHRVITTVVTNVPGPRDEQHLLGRRMTAMYPYVPIGDGLRIGVAVVSYAGRLHFGVTCDRASVPDAGLFVETLERALDQLVHVRPLTPPSAAPTPATPEPAR